VILTFVGFVGLGVKVQSNVMEFIAEEENVLIIWLRVS
jgi:hypothetical protein